MSDLLLSGQPVYEAEIVEPIARAWTATVQLEAEAAPSGRVSLSYKGATWTGTIYRGGVYGGRYLARIVGGAGGLGTSLAARWYREITLRTVLDDIARETGEKLSSTVLAAVLDRDVPTWTREAGTAAMALDAVCDAFSLSWRVLRDGSVWLGAETWPTVSGTHVVTSERPDDARIEVAPELPIVLPGSTFRDRRVSETVYTINDSLRCRVLFELSTLGEMLRRLVRFFTRDDRYRAAYFGSVIAQNDDGTLDIKLETVTVPSPTQVPIRYGIPGISAMVKPGARVAVTYEDGDSRRPVATVWDAAEVEELNVTAKNVKVHAASVELGDGGRPIARSGDIVRSGGLGLMVSFITPGTAIGGPGPMTPGLWYPVFFWMPPGLPSPSLPGQISAFSANKSSLLCAAVHDHRSGTQVLMAASARRLRTVDAVVSHLPRGAVVLRLFLAMRRSAARVSVLRAGLNDVRVHDAIGIRGDVRDGVVANERKRGISTTRVARAVPLY